MNDLNFNSIVESILFVSGEPVNEFTFLQIMDLDRKTFKLKMNAMIEEYNKDSYGIKIINIDGAYQFVTKELLADCLRGFLDKKPKGELSQSALEVLTIIAYKQPITRVEIEEIRGVRCESLIIKLVEKGLIVGVDRLDTIGKPILYGTTTEFLRQFGLKSLNELPDLELYDSEVEVENVSSAENNFSAKT